MERSSPSPAMLGTDSSVRMEPEAEHSTDGSVRLKQNVDESNDSNERLKQEADQSIYGRVKIKQEIVDPSTDSCMTQNATGAPDEHPDADPDQWVDGLTVHFQDHKETPVESSVPVPSSTSIVDPGTDSCMTQKQDATGATDEHPDADPDQWVDGFKVHFQDHKETPVESFVPVRSSTSKLGVQPCHLCGALLPTSKARKAHMLGHMEKKHACPHCSASFKEAHHLRRHALIHSGEKPFACSLCSAAFRQHEHLKTHQITHSGENPFSCAVCNATFRLSCHLNKHMLIHSGRKLYSCSECKSAFTTSGNLKKHMTTHSGERPHACSQCSAAFRQSQHLKKHMLIHLGLKPFSCSLCSATFRLSCHLKRHMQIHSTHAMSLVKLCIAANPPGKTGNVPEMIEHKDFPGKV